MNKINYFNEIENLPQLLELKPSYLYNQLHDWVIKKNVIDFKGLTNISLKDRTILAERIKFKSIHVVKKSRSSKSETKKFLFKTEDDFLFESVLIEDKNGNYTLCISSQIGCSLNCHFCATGTMKLKRNLTQGEIIEQFYWLNQEANYKIKNIVFMGMGEPFLNLKNVFGALKILTGYFSFSAKRISVSTSGIIKGIEKLAHFPSKVNLCLSLHSAVQETRDVIMPDLVRLPIKDLKKALIQYHETTSKAVLIEYVMLKGINDDERHLQALVKFLRGMQVKVNLIAYNRIEFRDYEPSAKKSISLFQRKLKNLGYETIQRYKKGDDINAACGQLVLAK